MLKSRISSSTEGLKMLFVYKIIIKNVNIVSSRDYNYQFFPN